MNKKEQYQIEKEIEILSNKEKEYQFNYNIHINSIQTILTVYSAFYIAFAIFGLNLMLVNFSRGFSVILTATLCYILLSLMSPRGNRNKIKRIKVEYLENVNKMKEKYRQLGVNEI